MSSDLIGTTKTGSLGGNTALADNEGFVEYIKRILTTYVEKYRSKYREVYYGYETNNISL